MPAGVPFIQRFGSALNMNTHFHILFLEGVYTDDRGPGAAPTFHRLPPPNDEEVSEVVKQIALKVIARLRKRGYLPAEAETALIPAPDPLFQEHASMTAALQASVEQKIAFGPRAGGWVRRIGRGFGNEGELVLVKGVKTAAVNGFSLHAQTHVGGAQRQQLERLIRYTARSSLATDRLSTDDNGQLLYELKRPWGQTTHMLFDPLEFIEKLAALVPQPRTHMTRYLGALGPHSAIRERIIPAPPNEGDTAGDRPKNDTWSKLLARVFKVDVTVCPKCFGRLRIIAAVTSPDAIRLILTHLGLSPRPPPISPARIVARELFDDADPAHDDN